MNGLGTRLNKKGYGSSKPDIYSDIIIMPSIGQTGAMATNNHGEKYWTGPIMTTPSNNQKDDG